MYKVNRRTKYKNRIVPVLLIIALGSLGFAVWLWIQNDITFKSPQQPDVITSTVNGIQNEKTFDEQLFKITTPGDWELYQRSTNPTIYYFRSTAKHIDQRTLVIYIDAQTETYAVNRVFPVTPHGKKFITGDLSDVCSNFVGSADDSRRNQNIKAWWQKVPFVCDMGNTNRNSIGTSSKEGVNTVTLTGPETGKHAYFLIYTDHNSKPDFNLANRIISSLEAK